MNDNEKRDFCTGCGLLPQRPVKPKAPVCGCKKKKCCKKNCCDTEFAFRKVVIPAALGDDVTGKAKPENGAYTNSYVEYEANGAQYMYDSYGVYTKIEPGSEGTLDFNEMINRPKYAGVEMTGDTNIPNVGPQITALQGAVQDEKEARIAADGGLQTQIDALAASSDVTDIVGTYAELEAYDTQHLKDNDIIKVLQDETHDDETTYYRWSTSTETFTLIGEEGPYYTKAAADQKFQDKLTAGDGITIDSDNVISADGETIFYANLNETGTTRHIYKDINFTTAASAQDIIDANDKGQVILRGTSLVNPTAYSDSYLQNAFIMPHNNDYEFVFLDRDLRYEYTASATTDTAFYYDTSEIQPKLTAGTNINISGTTISATDTTYSNFTGTDGVDPGTSGLVPAPAAGDEGKYLKGDGTWGTVQGGIPTNATFWGQSYDSVNNKVDGALTVLDNGSTTVFGKQGFPATGASHKIGVYNVNSGLLLSSGGSYGGISFAHYNSTVAQMAWGGDLNSSYFEFRSKLRMSSNTSGNNRNKITYLGDPTDQYDATNKSYVDNLTISYAALNGTAAPTTATEAKYVGQLYYDTTNDDMYYCSAITAQGTTPETYTYTWNTIGGGGGIPTDATFWGASYDSVNNKVVGSMLLSGGASGGIYTIKNGDIGNYSSLVLANGSASLGVRTVTPGSTSTFEVNESATYCGNTLYMRNKSWALGARFRIKDLADPTQAQDAATKNYVDSIYPVGAVFTSTSATAPTIAGGTWTEIGTQTIGSSTVHYYERTA